MVKTYVYFNRLISVIGIIATIACVCWCVWQYCLDLDLSLVNHEKFGEHDNRMTPDFSLCFGDPFLIDNLNEYGLNVTLYDYKNFLLGVNFDKRMYAIDFVNVTKRQENYIKSYAVVRRDSTIERFHDLDNLPLDLKRPYLSYAGFEFGLLNKCYSTNLPVNSHAIFLTISKQIFPMGTRPNAFGFTVAIHYKHQLLSSFESVRNNWPDRKNKQNNSFTMIFEVKGVEVITRRNTKKNSCNENWKQDDQVVLKKSMEKTKCRAPYQIWNSHYPYCDTKEKVSKSHFQIHHRDKYPPPCQYIEKNLYNFNEHDSEELSALNLDSSISQFMNHSNDTFSINIALMSKKFKLITHKKAYDLQTLIGNCGGYIGLILGM